MQFTAVVLALVAVASAAPAQLERRDDTTCGRNFYSSDQVDQAAQAACDYVSQGATAGSSTYPHEYKDFEGFFFQGLSGPFYEFPILERGVYSGGSPGADRVVITADCQEAGVITHTGSSSRNGFVGCDGTS